MNYADFPQKSSILIEQNEWLRNIGYLWIFLEIVIIAYAIIIDASLYGRGFWFFMGIICIIWAHFSKVKYSVFRTERGNVHIIQDKQHDYIIEELRKRKKKQLFDWYSEVNPENALETEIGKFKWLLEQDVISKEQYDYRVNQAQLFHTGKSDHTAEQIS